jgi:cation diffusion facilitator CzcD-associated flavoprotein CzcO
MNQTLPLPARHVDSRAGATHTRLLVIGAGPYGLATAAAARAAGIEPFVVGEPMEFWRQNMPSGMFLRSSVDWHLDPQGQHTLAAYLEEIGLAAHEVGPIPLEMFIDYAEWFRAETNIPVQRVRVRDLRRHDGQLDATLEDGRRLRADAVVAAPGVELFTRLPSWVERAVSPERYSHTSRVAQPERFAGVRTLIVGGGQSAFETAALLAEAGAERIDIVHRHDPPRFTSADWRFVEPLMEATLRWPGWFRTLPAPHRQAIEHHFWAEGRLKLEPWLTPRLARREIRRWSNATVTSVVERPGGSIAVRLSGGEVLSVDHIILATGYEADLARVPYLAGVLDEIRVADGFPVLDEQFQTSVPGLFITGFAATRDFGPFFGFVRGATAGATIVASRGIGVEPGAARGIAARPLPGPQHARSRRGLRPAETAGRASASR